MWAKGGGERQVRKEKTVFASLDKTAGKKKKAKKKEKK